VLEFEREVEPVEQPLAVAEHHRRDDEMYPSPPRRRTGGRETD
jgi:hypothetical protein